MCRLLLLFSLSTVFISAVANNIFVCEHDSREECPSKLCYYSIKENCVYRGCATLDQCANRKENECYKDGNRYTCCCKTSGCTSNYRGLPLCGIKLNSGEGDDLANDAKNEDYEDFVIYTKSKRLATEITAQAETKLEQNEPEPAKIEPVVEEQQGQTEKVADETKKLVPKTEEQKETVEEAAPAPEVVKNGEAPASVENKIEEKTNTLEKTAELNEKEPEPVVDSGKEAPVVNENAASEPAIKSQAKVDTDEIKLPEQKTHEPQEAAVVAPVVVQPEPETATEEAKPLVPEVKAIAAERTTTIASTTTTVPTTTTTQATTTTVASTTTTTTTPAPTTTTVAETTKATTPQRPNPPTRPTVPATVAPVPTTRKIVELKKDVSNDDDSSENVFYPPTQPSRQAAPERIPAVQRAKFPAQPIPDRVPETSSVKSSRRQETDQYNSPMLPWWSTVLLGFIFAIAIAVVVVVYIKRKRNNSQNGTSNRRVEEPKNKDMLVDPLLLTKTVDERN